MTRTTKDIFIKGVTIEQAKTAVMNWFVENNVKVLIDNPDYLYGRMGNGILTAPKFFEVNLVPATGGVIAKTEGWIANIPPSFLPDARVYLPETEFSESALSFGWDPSQARHASHKEIMANARSIIEPNYDYSNWCCE
jgi:hypothetical protein